MIRNFYLSGVMIALFFILLIFTKKNKLKKDYVLAFFIFLLGSNLLINYGLSIPVSKIHPLVIFLDIFYWVLLGPTLFIYADLLIKGHNKIKWQYIYTLIPFLICTIGFSPYIFGDLLGFFKSFQTDSIVYKFYINVWFYNSPIFYILIIFTLRKHQNNIKHFFSYSKKIDLKWLYYLSNGFAIYLFSLLAPSLIRKFFGLNLSYRSFNYSWIVLITYIFAIGFFGIRQKNIFSSQDFDFLKSINIHDKSTEGKAAIIEKNGTSQKSYIKSGLNPDESKVILANLLSIMEKEEPYLESEINLQTLAKLLHITTHKLSQVINENLNKNFYDFINGYRLMKFKEKLPEFNNEVYNITSLAYECGFNSKSSFYNIFKKLEKMTPTQYLKQIKPKIS